MSPVALALVLVTALAHATWNLAARGVRADPRVFVFGYVVWSALLWLPIAVLGRLIAPESPNWAWLLAPVASTRETSIVGGSLLGTQLLGEPGGRRRGIGAVVVLAGIVLVAV